MNSIRFKCLIKYLQILLVLMLLVSVCLAVVACRCNHDYSEEITLPASCDSVGEVTYTCSKCGDFYKEELPALGNHDLSPTYTYNDDAHWQKCNRCDYATVKVAHNYETIVSNELSTCVTQGAVVKSCVCGKTYTESLPLAEHNYVIYQKQGDKHWLKCENCDSTTAEETHNFDIQVAIMPSTCIKQGSETKKCVCGETQTETLPFAQHSYTKSMYNDDEHWFVCETCEDENTNQARLPHVLTVKTTESDCVKAGKTVTTCGDCNYTKTDVIPALGHDLDEEVGFSSSSTGSGHYYKCNRCEKNIAVPHILENCECPDGYNREATCYKAGHQDMRCSVCGWRNHFTTSMTNLHDWSTEWTSNDTYHWHACLNGDGACTAKGEETQHTWETKIAPATCEENGREWHECSVCGREQKSYNKIIQATGHDYEDIKVITPASCTENGEMEQRCKTCGAEGTAVIKALGHDMSSYDMELTDVNNHYRQCSVCGFTNTTSREHTWNDKVVNVATCTSDGLTIRTCEYCKFTYEQTTTKNHSYVTDPNSYVDATCKDYGTHIGVCSECGDTQTFEDKYLGYAEHTVKYYPEKEMTETERGNRPYWQCTVCEKYFTSHGCVEELTEEQVFTYPPSLIRVESISKLIENGLKLSNNEISDDYYLIEATVDGVEAETNTLMLVDSSDELIFVTLIDRENVSTINENDSIVLKGKLMRSDDEVILVDCQVISVDCGDDELYSLFFTVVDDSPYINYYISAYYDEMNDTYLPNTNNYNCLIQGAKLTFNYYDFNNKTVLQKVIINGKAYTALGGMLEITVTEDIHAEFVFDHNNYCSVTIRELDTTNNNGNEIIADEYISYKYTNGGYNDDGRLHKNSHLTFTANNANITGINITYEADWLTSNPQILDNIVYAIKESGAKIKVEQGSANGNSQIKISLSASDAYTALEYFASASQARVVEIIVLYETYNTFYGE